MSDKRIDLTYYENKYTFETPPDPNWKGKPWTTADLKVLLDELKRTYEKLDMANEAMLTAREVLMKHHEWMSVNDATSEEDDQEILDVVKALREASE